MSNNISTERDPIEYATQGLIAEINQRLKALHKMHDQRIEQLHRARSTDDVDRAIKARDALTRVFSFMRTTSGKTLMGLD